MKLKPKKVSIRKHQVPEWFHDAKLGIFIHWGLYSVPAFAITGVKGLESENWSVDNILKIELLGHNNDLSLVRKDNNLEINLPDKIEDAPAYSIKITLK